MTCRETKRREENRSGKKNRGGDNGLHFTAEIRSWSCLKRESLVLQGRNPSILEKKEFKEGGESESSTSSDPKTDSNDPKRKNNGDQRKKNNN